MNFVQVLQFPSVVKYSVVINVNQLIANLQVREISSSPN